MRSRLCSIWVFVGITELKNQTIAFVEVLMSNLTKIGDYELLEKKNEGFET